MSAKPGHTPGPWNFDHDWGRIPTVFGPDGRQMIACVERRKRMLTNPGTQEDLPEREANARLIAAAPDMLAALYKIAQGGNSVRTDWPASPALDRESMCDIARAAIIKATE